MKISKVNHTSTGVGKRVDEYTGMLYSNPARGQADDARYLGEALEARVQKLNATAQRLYGLFNELQDTPRGYTRNDDKEWKLIAGNAKKLVGRLMQLDKSKRLAALKNMPVEYSVVAKKKGETQKVTGAFAAAFAKIGIDAPDDCRCEKEDLIHDYMQLALRKSFCKIVKGVDLCEVTETIICAMADQNCTKDYIGRLTDAELNAFLENLDKDYHKSKQLELVIDSILKHDTKVQVFEADGEKRLALSAYGIDKKKPLFDYMISYASGDTAKREEMRKAIRSLITDYLASGSSDGVVLSEAIEKKLIEVAEPDKTARRRLAGEAVAMLDKEICDKFGECKQDLDEQELYWLRFFSDETERYAREEIRKHRGQSYSDSHRCLTNVDVFNHLYKHFLSFLASKYVDLGKAVYHFTDMTSSAVLPEFEGGVTSFDYERIAAEDDVKRDMQTYVAFAVNNFAHSICTNETLAQGGNEDALSSAVTAYRPAAKKYILRFFGGISTWADSDCITGISDSDLVDAFRNALGAVRNSVFHHDAAFSERRATPDDIRVFESIFANEKTKISLVYASKYFSNNTPMFFSENDLYAMINKALYQDARIIGAGLPAFNRIVPRSKADEFLKVWVGNTAVSQISSKGAELYNKYLSAMFFVLKEIYYYGFLGDAKFSDYMQSALTKMQNDNRSIVNERERKQAENAFDNYTSRYRELQAGKFTTIQICERIMTDFAMQNNAIKEVKVTTGKKKGSGDQEIYQHFRMLLYKQLKYAFMEYLNATRSFDFLKRPVDRTSQFAELTVDRMTENIQVNMYDSLDEVMSDSEMMSWYITAHFMSTKQLNHLCGAIRTELCYLEDIDRRAHSTKSMTRSFAEEKVAYYGKLLRVLEFTMLHTDLMTNSVEDYFADEDDYARVLARYVDFGKVGSFPKDALVMFCQEEMPAAKSGVIGLYADATRPIANRNIIRASMYGDCELFTGKVLTKVTKEDIAEYYRLRSQAEAIYLKSGERTKEEQMTIRRFQNLKNRVELTDVMEYVDVVNDLYGQLLSWTYLRERDLTYMQLGFHYAECIWGGKLTGVEAAKMLYSVRAMYSHDLKPIIESTGTGRVSDFIGAYGVKAYVAGLELFEDVDLHDECVHLRNYLAHFKYFANADHSMEELYGDIFSVFFSYDPNLHKSVPVVFKNILAKHKIIADIEITESESAVYYTETKRKFKNVKWSVKRDVTVEDKYGKERKLLGLDSDKLTFKITGDRAKECQLDAHDSYFLANIRKLLTAKSGN